MAAEVLPPRQEFTTKTTAMKPELKVVPPMREPQISGVRQVPYQELAGQHPTGEIDSGHGGQDFFKSRV